MKNFLVLPDSFKGTLSSIEVCEIMQNAIKKQYVDAKVRTIPVADGGEGTVEAFLKAMPGKKIYAEVTNPLGEKMKGYYALLDDGTAIVEMAVCAGLPLIKDRLNPQKATTFGVGELILDAIEHKAKKIILGLGGSATNDGGCGMAAALGVKFFDKQGQAFIPTGGTLLDIEQIDMTHLDERIKQIDFESMCDVDNPLCGECGASAIFGPQKGATPEMVKYLDRGLAHLATKIKQTIGVDVREIAGAGAAGGLGAGSVAFLNSKLIKGIDVVLDVIDFKTLLETADMVFTGEGKFDNQSLRGKVVMGIARHCKLQNVPVIVVTGAIGENIQAAYEQGVTAIFSINNSPLAFAEAAPKSKENMQLIMDNILRVLKL